MVLGKQNPDKIWTLEVLLKRKKLIRMKKKTVNVEKVKEIMNLTEIAKRRKDIDHEASLVIEGIDLGHMKGHIDLHQDQEIDTNTGGVGQGHVTGAVDQDLEKDGQEIVPEIGQGTDQGVEIGQEIGNVLEKEIDLETGIVHGQKIDLVNVDIETKVKIGVLVGKRIE